LVAIFLFLLIRGGVYFEHINYIEEVEP